VFFSKLFLLLLDFLSDWSGPAAWLAIYVAAFHKEGKP
jgi:hypothetical protein